MSASTTRDEGDHHHHYHQQQEDDEFRNSKSPKRRNGGGGGGGGGNSASSSSWVGGGGGVRRRGNGKETIPETVKNVVWHKYVGKHRGVARCVCCKTSEITQRTCSFGHVQAEARGGAVTIQNLRPICVKCNSSMGTTNMRAFVLQYGFHPRYCCCSICRRGCVEWGGVEWSLGMVVLLVQLTVVFIIYLVLFQLNMPPSSPTATTCPSSSSIFPSSSSWL